MTDPRRTGVWLTFALGAILMGCDAPREAMVPITLEAAARGTPHLVETAQFASVLDDAAPAAARLSDQRDTLAAQAEALRARAAALNAPVLDPATRTRLITAQDAARP